MNPPRPRTRQGSGGGSAEGGRGPAPDGLARLPRVAAALRWRARGAVLAGALGVAAAVLGLLAILPPELGHGRGSPLPLLGSGLLLALAAVAWMTARRAARALRPDALAAEADTQAGLGAGDVLAALELDGSGDPLAASHRRRVSGALGSLAADRFLARSRGRWNRALRSGALVAAGGGLLVTGLFLARPQRTTAAAAALAAPWRVAFPPPLPPLEVAPGDARVPRGSPLRVRVGAAGREEVRLAWRVEGEAVRGRTLRVAEGSARGSTPPVRVPFLYWVTAPDGAASDTFRVEPIEPLLVEDLQVRVIHPAWLGREDEVHVAPVPSLVVPEGARLAVEGRANRPLRSAELRPLAEEGGVGHGSSVRLETEGTAFRGAFRPRASGSWSWRLREAGPGDGEATEGAHGADGADVPDGSADVAFGAPEPLRVDVVPDAPPSVRILHPTSTSAASPEGVAVLVAEAEDDVGLASVELLGWRAAAGARQGPETREIGGEAAGRDRAVLRPLLDLRGDGLLPGDTALYVVRVRDAHPRHAAVVSDTVRVVLPSLADLRRAAADGSDELGERVRRLRDAAAEMDRAARESARRSASAAARRSPAGPSSAPAEAGQAGEAPPGGFDETGAGRRLLERAEGLDEDLDRLRTEVEGLRQTLESLPATGADVEERRERLRALEDELGRGRLAPSLEAVRRAMRRLDAEALTAALERLAEEAEGLRQRLDRDLGVLERTAIAAELDAARAEARDLAERQGEAAEASAGADPEGWRELEEELAGRAGELSRDLERLAARVQRSGAGGAADSTAAAGRRSEAAARAMRRAAESGAGEGAGEAARELSRAASALEAAADGAGTEWRERAAEAVSRARREALELAGRQSGLAGELGARPSTGPDGLAEWRARQGALRQGLENLRAGLGRAETLTPLLDPSIGEAAEGLSGRMRRVLEFGDGGVVGRGGSRPFPAAVEGLAEDLNDLALRLLEGERRIRAAPSAASAGEELARMGALAERQEGLARRAGGLAEGAVRPGRMEEPLQRLSREQEEVGRDLRRLEEAGARRGRPGDMAREAEALARRLAAGRLDEETLERQRRLFRRLLDAGRSLEGDDLDTERRTSRTGAPAAGHRIPALDPEVLLGTRFPVPRESVLRATGPAYRSLILDYFDRLNGRGSPGRSRPGAPGGEPGGAEARP